MIDSRLGGKIASAWQDITTTTCDYQEARDRLLKICGYTPRLAADSFFGYRMEQSKGLTADQLYHRGQQLLRRMIAPGRQSEEIEFAILRGWVGNVISKRARSAVDARVVTNAEELISALQDFLVLDRDRSEGQTATFGKGTSEVSKERGSAITCYKCGKVGHKAIECWKGGASVPKGGASTSVGVASRTITCYTCGEEGHKSPQCPRQWKNEKTGGKDAKPKPVKRVWRSQPKCVQLVGMVDGQTTPILLDSGAAISVVPEALVSPERLTGSKVAVKSFAAREPMLLPTAILPFKIGELEWEERVAIAPRQEGAEEEVLYSLDLHSERGLRLVLMVNEIDDKDVLRVTTRAQAQKEKQEEEEEVIAVRQEVPRIKSILGGVTRHEVLNEPKTAIASVTACDKGEVLDRKEVGGGVLGRQEEDVVLNLGLELDSSDEGEEVFELRKESREEPDLVVPLVKVGTGSREALIAETRSDPSLKNWRDLAGKGEKGFLWERRDFFGRITFCTRQ